MTTILVRKNCEYSATVEVDDDLVDWADREQDALKKAEALPLSEWDTAWTEVTAEDEVTRDERPYRTDMPAGMRGED